VDTQIISKPNQYRFFTHSYSKARSAAQICNLFNCSYHLPLSFDIMVAVL
jgi:hypothetical protein